ncbi:methyltransferase domain-containing protein [Telmatocola sphagniphila]|uniref:Methyltransferase domain-containing protein n=1 Tax=Telmatocola sphagniphila TaxID=1123043 RepID=A0A8E6BB49_9BACT|nr:rRNA adenine N-6-methyltransferase family protein [Telmatocola sphagniphila]QVL34799.1 methyltransferase domain-containing protein [Telmatocola sphagniphila]
MIPGSTNSPNNGTKKLGKSSLSDWWLVFSKFRKHGSKIATMIPSSRFLSRKIIKGIDFDKAKCIVELGAGTGPITQELLKRVKPHTKLLIIEKDADFCNRLRERFPSSQNPNAEIIEGDAARLDQILAERGLETADHVVSGLPLPSIPENIRYDIMASSMRVLGPNGTFRQLTVMPWVYRRLYKKYFGTVKFDLVPLNFPPAGVYFCQGFRFSNAS